MALTAYSDELIINSDKKILFYCVGEQKVKRTIEISPDVSLTVDQPPVGPEASENVIPPATNETLNRIQDVRVSPNGRLLSAGTSGRKLLLLYEIVPGALNLLSARRISRASSAITFSPDSSKVFVCDKTGDCYAFDCVEYDTPGKWIFGHLSMVLDVRFTPQQDLILTSDRDEKIRVTNYPATHDIECYCLGHTEYVSSINMLPTDPENAVISLSGDKTVKVWNCRSGKKLHEIHIPAPGVKLIVRKVDHATSHLGVFVYDSEPSILVYSLQQSEGAFESSLISSHSFPEEKVLDIGFCEDSLYISSSREGRLHIKSVPFTSGKYEPVDQTLLTSAVETVFADEQISELRDVSGWFKKKYDNVSHYLERKKRRIDEKLGKNKSVRCS